MAFSQQQLVASMQPRRSAPAGEPGELPPSGPKAILSTLEGWPKQLSPGKEARK